MSVTFLPPGDPGIGKALRRDGVAYIQDLFDADLIQQTRDALTRYEREVIPTIPRSYYSVDDDGVMLGQYRDVEQFDPWLNDLVHSPRIMDTVSAAVPWEPMIFYLEVFPKPPGASGADPHQDLYTAPVDPPHFLHLWVPLEDVHPGNGGINFYHGTHKLGIAPHIERPGCPPVVDPDLMKRIEPMRVEVRAKAGCAALFGGYMIHCSGRNDSDRARPALVIGFRGTDTKISTEVDIISSAVTRLFREETGVKTVAVEEDFFAIGGSEDGAGRIGDQIKRDYRVEVDVHDYRSPRAIADRVMQLRTDL